MSPIEMTQERKSGAARAGSVSVEFAFTVPLLVVLLFATYEVSDCLRVYTKVAAAAQTVASVVTQQTSVVNAASGAGSLGDYCAAANAVIAPYSSSSLTLTVASVTQGAGGQGTDWHKTCPDTANVTAVPTVPSGTLNAVGDSVIIVTATYSYANAVQFWFPSGLSLTQTAYSKPRSNATITLQ